MKSIALCFDLDDTLFLTREAWRAKLIETNGQTAGKIFERHGFDLTHYPTDLSHNVLEALNANDKCPAFYKLISANYQALHNLKILHTTLGFRPRYYLSSRDSSLRFITQQCIAKCGFPEAETILRPCEVNFGERLAWKIQRLRKISAEFQGPVIHFDDEDLFGSRSSRVVGNKTQAFIFQHGDVLFQEAIVLHWDNLSNFIARFVENA